MHKNLSRRNFVAGGLALVTAGPAFADVQPTGDQLSIYEMQLADPALLPPPESEIDFPIPEVSLDQIPKQFRRAIVEYETVEEPGTIIVDPDRRYLYYVLEGGQSIRYGVGVGRSGFAWAGEAQVAMKRRWPRWVPPAEMVARDANASKWASGQPGGPDNPLGARALYLFANGVDTMYRLHGTNEPSSIGKAVSSGCVRLLNQDIAELYPRVPIGTKVVVLASQGSDA